MKTNKERWVDLDEGMATNNDMLAFDVLKTILRSTRSRAVQIEDTN